MRFAGSPAIAVAGPVFVTAKSALFVEIVVIAVELLLFVFESVVVLLIVAVLDNTVPLLTLLLTCVTKVKLAEAPAANIAIVSVIVFPLLLKLNAGPLVCDWLTNVSLADRVSLSDTPCASDEPLFTTVIV